MGYTLYGTMRSRAFRVRWMLEELGVAYDHAEAKPRSDAVRAVSPLGKIPVLVDGETVVIDSSAILTYLADRHGMLTAPAGTLERAAQDAMTFRLLDEADAVLWTASRHSYVLAEAERLPGVAAVCGVEFARNMARLFDGFEGPYLMGEDMRVPDIILTHCGGWAKVAGFPEPEPVFAGYLDRMRARPAFRAAMR